MNFFCIEIVDFWLSNAVGISSPDVIPDDHMTASSHFNISYQPAYGRLHGIRGGAWCAKTPKSKDDWLQVDLAETFQVSAVATQGNRASEERVTIFKLSYSIDGINWKLYQDGNGTDWVRWLPSKCRVKMTGRWSSFLQRVYGPGCSREQKKRTRPICNHLDGSLIDY